MSHLRLPNALTMSGIKFFYQRTLKRDWTTLGLVRPRPQKKLPVVLSREEVRRILEQVHTAVYRACLKTIYSCGLRLREGSQLQVADIDSGRMFLHVHGKGGKDRYVPLPDRTLDLLREFLENAPISAVAVSPYQPRFEARRGDRSLDRQQPAEGVQARRRRRRYLHAPTFIRFAIRMRRICWKRG